MSSLPRCYIASPWALPRLAATTIGRCTFPHSNRLSSLWTHGHSLARMRSKDAHDRGQHREIALEIGRRNAAAIRSCELFVAYLEGQESDSGTVAELGYAAALHVKCFALRSDLRLAGEIGVEVTPRSRPL